MSLNKVGKKEDTGKFRKGFCVHRFCILVEGKYTCKFNIYKLKKNS